MGIRFLDYEVDHDRLELRGPSGTIPMEPQVFQLLVLLIDNRDRVVSKDELIEHIWDGRIVSDAAVTSRINLVRKAIGDSGSAQSVIRTHPKRGYRFIADVEEADLGRPNTDPGSGDWLRPDPSAPSVVVLPFRDLAPPQDRDFLAEGLTEEISVALSRSSDVTVIANRSAMAVEDIAPLVSDVGRTLNAKYVVQGSVQRAGGQVRVTAKVIDSEIGKHLWADLFEGAMNDIFDIQDRVAGSIAAVLPSRIQGTVFRENRSLRKQSLSAYEAFLKATWTLRETGDVFRAIDDLAELLKSHEKYALAHAQLAVLLGFSVFVAGRDDPQVRTRSVAHARQALALDSSDERVLAKSALAFLNTGDFKRALHYSERALALNPHSVEAIHFRACVLYGTGEAEAALDHNHAAMQLDPLFPSHYAESVIESNYLLGRYDTAIEVFENWDRPHQHMALTMAACHAMRGDMDRARRFAQDFRQSMPAGFRLAEFFAAMMRYLEREQDRTHWREGFVRSGLWPGRGKSGPS